MTDFDIKRMVEQTLYVLNAVPGLTQYNLYKVLYFAERKHLAKWGLSFFPTEFYAWKCGPVPKRLYYGLKYMGGQRLEDVALADAIVHGEDDACSLLFAKRKPDMDWLSESEVDVLNESINENARLSFGDLLAKSHDNAWSMAYAAEPGKAEISHASMALAEGCNDELVEYIREIESTKASLA